MGKIGVILPYSKLYDQALSIKEKIKVSEHDIEIRLGLLSNAVDVAKDLIKGGAEILVSRGGTSKYLKKEFPEIPLVEIEISSYDIAEALMQAKKINRHIALVLFKNMLFENRDLSELFDATIKIFYIENEKDAEENIKKAKDEEYGVIVGGSIANKICNQRGIHSVLITSGTDSILRAIKQAENILQYRSDIYKQSQLVKTVIENTPLGILTSDINGKIKMVNSSTITIIGLSREFLIGKSVYDIFPEIKNSNNFIKEFNFNKVIVDANKMQIHSADIGYIVTMEEVSAITKKEKYIRSAFVKKGHVAHFNFNDIIGNSQIIQETKQVARRYANFDSTVLIFGETGTGKEMFAQSIHNSSKRAKGPFVAVNCAFFSENLMESELFGYVEGAFTGASKYGKAGLFEMADKGTIFLDEVSGMPLSIQSKLLRVIQEKTVMRLGDDKVIPIDVRIIVASNENLDDIVKNGNFRKDLYYRLNVLSLTIPPLREREADIIPLFEYFLEKDCLKFQIKQPIIEKGVYDVLRSYSWPGNIRELENFTERLVAVYGSNYISLKQIKQLLNMNKICDFQKLSTNEVDKSLMVSNFNEDDIIRALNENNFNKTKTAKQLGIGRTTLWRMLKKMSSD